MIRPHAQETGDLSRLPLTQRRFKTCIFLSSEPCVLTTRPQVRHYLAVSLVCILKLVPWQPSKEICGARSVWLSEMDATLGWRVLT